MGRFLGHGVESSSSHFGALVRLRAFLERNQIQQDTLHRVELGGVNERIGAHVDIGHDRCDVEADLVHLRFRTSVEDDRVDG